MRFAGWQRVSFGDYPGKVATALFTQGCRYRCPYCHNPALVPRGVKTEGPDEQQVLAFLEKREGMIDGLVVSGGEPTLHSGLRAFLHRVKERTGVSVKLDTNGDRPEGLEAMLSDGLIDYVAMDLKAPLARYPEVVRVPVTEETVRRSIHAILDTGVDHEFRTTCVKPLLTPRDLMEMGRDIMGAKRYLLQSYVNRGVLDTGFGDIAVSFGREELLTAARHITRATNIDCRVRRCSN